MRLKSLEMTGFKSFPDRTALDFNSGMTVVVGPNGSGKSNISDAIRWVLGELSAKNVRGTKMEDVIFGGSDTRKQLPFAEVTLTLDNTEDGSGGRINSDYDEVTVTRRCYRNGESEYQINRKPVRLRDISELFMNTGIGKTGYSIIGQGRIAEILSQRSDERRVIFEEAAGISKYRYKKNEAEKKLAGVDENLVRLNDILAELSARLGPLEKESEKARRYLEIYEQKKQTDISLWLHDLTDIKSQTDIIEAEYSAAKGQYEAADQTLTALESQSDRLFGLTQESKLNAERMTERVGEYRDRRHELESSRLVLENDITHIQSQIKDCEEEINVRRAAREEAVKNSERLEHEEAELSGGLALLEAERDKLNAELETLRDQRTIIEAEQVKRQSEIVLLNASLTESRIKSAAAANSRENLASRRSEIDTDLKGIERERELIAGRIDAAEKSIADYAAKADEIKAALSVSDGECDGLKKRAAALGDEINKLSLDKLSKKQRADTLRRMDELFEGYAQSVRAVMKAADEHRLDGIHGPVSKIITVKPKLAVAIETAVGANIQNIVVADESSAKSAIAYLKNNNAGRATFYPLTSMKSTPLNISEQSLKSYAGYIGIASSLVEFEPEFACVVEYMLGRTVVFDTLDNATVMAKATGYRVRAVTLDGQLINAGGSFTGGSVKRDAGMLTRGSEISRYEADMVRSDIEIKARQDMLDKINAELDERSKQNSGEVDRLTIINRMYQAENTQLQVLKSQYQADSERIDALKSEKASLDSRSNNTDSDLEALSTLIEQTETSLAEEKQSYDEVESRRKSLNDVIIKKSDAVTALSLKIAECGKDVEAARKSIQLAAETLSSIDELTERGERLVFGYNESITEARNKISANTADAEALASDIEELDAKLIELNAASGRQDAELQQLRSKIKDQTHIRETVFREYSRLESKRQQLFSEQDKLTSKLWEEYELTYSGASELGYTAIDESSRQQTIARQTELRSKIRAIGPVSTSSIDEYKEVRDRHSFMSAQIDDLVKSKADLAGIIDSLEREMRQRFSDTIDSLTISFNGVFRELFGGGSAELKLTDPSNILESGIEINVAPPGKIIKSLNILSGGEQAFVAIALFFAILNINPTPFCVLDEIEAALDDVNVVRFAEYARRYSDRTQFIIITHRRGTMERADTIYGVTMPQRGISKILTLNVSEVEEKLGVKL